MSFNVYGPIWKIGTQKVVRWGTQPDAPDGSLHKLSRQVVFVNPARDVKSRERIPAWWSWSRESSRLSSEWMR